MWLKELLEPLSLLTDLPGEPSRVKLIKRRKHEYDDEPCWCSPLIQYVTCDDGTVGELVIHRDEISVLMGLHHILIAEPA